MCIRLILYSCVYHVSHYTDPTPQFVNATERLNFSDDSYVLSIAKKYINTVQGIINKFILGSDLAPAHWRIKLSDDGKEIGILCMNNNQTRKVVNNLELLIDVLVVDPERLAQWNIAVPSYRERMSELWRRDDFDSKDIPPLHKSWIYFSSTGWLSGDVSA
jgi:hypothetical protein